VDRDLNYKPSSDNEFFYADYLRLHIGLYYQYVMLNASPYVAFEGKVQLLRQRSEIPAYTRRLLNVNRTESWPRS
jgi:hypothetical protein